MVIKDWERMWLVAKDFGEQGNVVLEEALLRQAVWLGQKSEGPLSLEIGHLLMDLGDCLYKQRKAEAEVFYERAGQVLIVAAMRQGVMPESRSLKRMQ